jgi:hypothetical protein
VLQIEKIAHGLAANTREFLDRHTRSHRTSTGDRKATASGALEPMDDEHKKEETA